MQKDPNDRYQNATEMLDDLSRALKMPDEDFVKIATKDLNSPTQKIPTISEMEMERRNERKAPCNIAGPQKTRMDRGKGY